MWAELYSTPQIPHTLQRGKQCVLGWHACVGPPLTLKPLKISMGRNENEWCKRGGLQWDFFFLLWIDSFVLVKASILISSARWKLRTLTSIAEKQAFILYLCTWMCQFWPKHLCFLVSGAPNPPTAFHRLWIQDKLRSKQKQARLRTPLFYQVWTRRSSDCGMCALFGEFYGKWLLGSREGCTTPLLLSLCFFFFFIISFGEG